MEIKHNSCPKCGNENPTFVRLIGSAEGCAQVRCRKCGFVGPFSQIPMDAWALWDIATAERTETPAEPRKTQQPTTRKTILDAATTCVCKERNDQYGEPEDCFQDIANLWAAYKGVDFDPFDVAMMMALLKVARAKANPKHTDNYIDLCGYGSIAGELANKEENK